MGRIQIACDFVPVSSKTTGSSPSLTLKNPKGHLLSLHAISSSTIRVVHTLPDNYHQKYNNGIQWEDSLESKVEIKVGPDSARFFYVNSELIEVHLRTTFPPVLYLWKLNISK